MRHATDMSSIHKTERNIETIEEKLKQSVEAEVERKESQAVSHIKTNPKYFYKYAGSKSKVKAEVGPLKDEQDRLIREPEEIAELLRLQYEKVFSTPSEKKIILSPRDFFAEDTESMPSLTDIKITETDIIAAIKDIGNNAAVGPDQFPALLLKNCDKEISVPLCIFYRNSLDCGLIPK